MWVPEARWEVILLQTLYGFISADKTLTNTRTDETIKIKQKSWKRHKLAVRGLCPLEDIHWMYGTSDDFGTTRFCCHFLSPACSDNINGWLKLTFSFLLRTVIWCSNAAVHPSRKKKSVEICGSSIFRFYLDHGSVNDFSDEEGQKSKVEASW